jgi:hypothetical protein
MNAAVMRHILHQKGQTFTYRVKVTWKMPRASRPPNIGRWITHKLRSYPMRMERMIVLHQESRGVLLSLTARMQYTRVTSDRRRDVEQDLAKIVQIPIHLRFGGSLTPWSVCAAKE